MDRSQAASRRTPSEKKMRVKVVGVGGAGVNAVDRLVLDGFDEVDLLAVNTDAQALVSSVVPEKLQIGEHLTRGLGTGGDPQIGRTAAMEDIERLRDALEGYDLVFIAAGMGGGTGTGAGPVISRIARESGALVLAFVTLPFSHEGQQRTEVARQGLDEMRQAADALLEIPNDKLLAIGGENTSVLDAFRPADEFLCNSARRIWQMLSRTGLINIDFADLCAVLRRRDGETLIGLGEGSGEKKAEQALENALGSPFLSDAGLLTRATQMLVAVTHGPDLPMRGLQRLLEDVQRRMGPKVACKQGIIVDENYRDRVSLLIVASTGTFHPEEPAHRSDEKSVGAVSIPCRKKRDIEGVVQQEALSALENSRAGSLAEKSGRHPVVSKRKIRAEDSADAHKQETLRLDETTHGMFERGERTVINGEDLDLPTFIRRGVSIRVM